MLSKRLFALLPLSLSLLLAPDYAAAATPDKHAAARDACYAEAQWPVTASNAYVYGNARQREQQVNGSNREAYAMRRLCYRLTTDTSNAGGLAAECADRIAGTMKYHGAKAEAHARRQKALCENLSGQSITVDGL